MNGLRDDDTGLFALEFVGAGELAAEKFDEAAGKRAAVGAQKAHAIKEDEELEDFGVLGMTEGRLRRGLFSFGKKSGKRIIKSAFYGRSRRFFVNETGGEGFPGFGEGLQGGEDIEIRCGGLGGAEFCDGEGNGREKLRMQADEVRGKTDVEQRSIRGDLARVLVFVAMRGQEIGAVGRAVESDFAFGAAADSTDFFGFCRAKAFRFAFLADWAEHAIP